jgi:hypothetical protein
LLFFASSERACTSYMELKDKTHELHGIYQAAYRDSQREMDALPLYHEFHSEAIVANTARRDLEEMSHLLAECAQHLSQDESESQCAVLPVLAYYNLVSPLPKIRQELRNCGVDVKFSEDYVWTSGLIHSRASKFIVLEARNPTFHGFPSLTVPVIVHIHTASDMSRRAVLHFSFSLQYLLAWGFTSNPDDGIATICAPDIVYKPSQKILSAHSLKTLRSAKTEFCRNACAELQIISILGSNQESLSCPADIWDEPPNLYWHPIAERICREVWAEYEDSLALEKLFIRSPCKPDMQLSRSKRSKADSTKQSAQDS